MLAGCAVSPTQYAASVSTDAAIAVCFAPEEDCAAFSVRAIDKAEREILVAAYRLTVGSGIVGALIRAKERGVDVRLIADKAAPCGRASGIDPLAPLACQFGSAIERRNGRNVANRRWIVRDIGRVVLLTSFVRISISPSISASFMTLAAWSTSIILPVPVARARTRPAAAGSKAVPPLGYGQTETNEETTSQTTPQSPSMSVREQRRDQHSSRPGPSGNHECRASGIPGVDQANQAPTGDDSTSQRAPLRRRA
jgi:hypothetical protein